MMKRSVLVSVLVRQLSLSLSSNRLTVKLVSWNGVNRRRCAQCLWEYSYRPHGEKDPFAPAEFRVKPVPVGVGGFYLSWLTGPRWVQKSMALSLKYRLMLSFICFSRSKLAALPRLLRWAFVVCQALRGYCSGRSQLASAAGRLATWGTFRGKLLGFYLSEGSSSQ